MGIVIKNGLVLTPRGEIDAIEPHTLYLEGQDIVGIDKAPEEFEHGHAIDAAGCLIIPGLINAHTHTYMSFMRNVADDLSFTDWLFNTVNPIEDNMEPEDAYWGSLLSQIEMVRSGTTTFNDQQMHIGMTTRAVRESGMRAVICRGLVGTDYDKTDSRLSEALKEIDMESDCSRLTFLLGPHAPYSCGPDYLRMVADVAKEKGFGIHIHVAESASESEGIFNSYGCTPVKYVEQAGIFDVPCIAAHCVRVNEADRAILKQHNVNVVTNPASNMKLGNGFAPVPELVNTGINVCLGTDGAASNNAQNMFREMGLLSLIHKGTHNTPQCISAAQSLRMATANGARALGLNTGSIEVGKKADLAILDLNTPSLMPNNNLIAALAYSANGSEVETVIIDGQIVMEHRELRTIDEERVYSEIRRICKRLGLS